MNSQAYWNGSWVPSEGLSIPLEDLGFLMGVTVIERLRTFGGELFRFEKHMSRMQQSLEILGCGDMVELSDEVSTALAQFMERNGPLIAEGDDWSVVVFVTPGQSADASQPTVCVHGYPLPFHSWAEQFESGIDAAIVDVRQIPQNCWPAALKCRSRMHYYLADREAEAKQPGAKAILLDQEGFVGEGSTANVVAYFADRGLVTPRRSKVLPGVTQEVLFELADALEIPCCEADMLPEEFADADEIYFVSTSICVLPVVRLDNKRIGDGKPGPMYRRLLEAWSEHVGIDVAQQAVTFSNRKK